jgi:hypothetical protein
MRILLLTQYYWPENFPINGLVPLLVARGVEVTVLTGKPNYPDGLIFEGYRAGGRQRELHNGTVILRLPIVSRGSRSRTRLALNYLSFILSIWYSFTLHHLYFKHCRRYGSPVAGECPWWFGFRICGLRVCLQRGESKIGGS